MRRRIRRRRRIKIIVTILTVVCICVVIGIFKFVNWEVKCENRQTISKSDSVESESESDVIEIPEETDKEEEAEEVPQYKIVVKKKLIAKHSIDNPSSSADRNNNLKVASKIINASTKISNKSAESADLKKIILKKFGKKKYLVLMPKEKFSWLETVGNPTESKGFKKAGVIINKQPAQDWGGGVCQVSSTIYSAVCKTNLKKGSKNLYSQKHSRKSSYINPEEGDKEATVTYSGNIDFYFTNTLNCPILIKVKTKDDKVTCKIYSVKSKKIKINSN